MKLYAIMMHVDSLDIYWGELKKVSAEIQMPSVRNPAVDRDGGVSPPRHLPWCDTLRAPHLSQSHLMPCSSFTLQHRACAAAPAALRQLIFTPTLCYCCGHPSVQCHSLEVPKLCSWLDRVRFVTETVVAHIRRLAWRLEVA
jgi:hypothetical protein